MLGAGPSLLAWLVVLSWCSAAVSGFMPILDNVGKLSRKRDCRLEILPNLRLLESNILDASYGGGGGVGLSGGIEIAIDDDLCLRMLHHCPKGPTK